MSELRGKIGLEVHVQLNTRSKLFCSCTTTARDPNSATCPVCLGLPGAKPVLNKKAVELATRLALALNCKINQKSFFSRKTYFYPDLAKNFQITQFEFPFAEAGYFLIGERKIRIKRIQIEEDPAALKHPEGIQHSFYVLADYNRSGMPLCEVVTEADFETAEQVKKFLDTFMSILEYIDIFNPKTSSLRTDTNISINKHPRVEIKEITGSKNVEKAISFELLRQEGVVQRGEEAKQQVRFFDAETGETYLSRAKETEDEYGYIFEPDLPPLIITQEFVKNIQEKMPELPQQKTERFERQYKMHKSQALQLTSELSIADLFEELAKKHDASLVATWLGVYLKKVLNYNGIRFSDTLLNESHIDKLLAMLAEGRVSDRAGELVLREMVATAEQPEKIAEKNRLLKISEEETEQIVKQVLKKSKETVDKIKAGDKKLIQFLVGEVVKASRGAADAKIVLNTLRKLL